MTGRFLPGHCSGPKTAAFVICLHKPLAGQSNPYFINTAGKTHRYLAYSAPIKAATTKGFL